MTTKEFAATDESMCAVNDFVHSLLPQDCPNNTLCQIDVAVEEIFINIAHYAYCANESEEKRKAFIDCGIDEKGAFTVVFRDFGKKFNPLAKEDPDITLSAEERNIGGLGIFLTKKFMTSVTYEYKDSQNILTIKKQL